MHTHIFLFPNRPGTNFQIIWMFPLSTLRTPHTQLTCILLTLCPASPPPHPAQPSPAWVSPRASWQRSKLVNTLLGSCVDFAIWLLTLCPANSWRRMFCMWKEELTKWGGCARQTPGVVIRRAPLSVSALADCPWILATPPLGKENVPHTLLSPWLPLLHTQPLSPHLDITEISLQLPLSIFQLLSRDTSLV